MLSNAFLKSLDDYVKLDLRYLYNWKPDERVKIRQHDTVLNFWYDNTIRLLVHSAIHMFMDIYNRKPTPLEDITIIDKINEYVPQYKQAFEPLNFVICS